MKVLQIGAVAYGQRFKEVANLCFYVADAAVSNPFKLFFISLGQSSAGD